MGAWIETVIREMVPNGFEVAPRVGAWIETLYRMPFLTNPVGRTPCGCVD